MNKKISPFISILLVSALSFFCCQRGSAQIVGDTLLNITYESGTTSSGIAGLSATNATAPDAAYMVSPGATGNWAIAHKVVYGDSGYWSDDNWRSESATNQLMLGCYNPGDSLRYEFSVFFKDWTPWNTGDPINETNFFQLKISAGKAVPLQIRTQRNALRIVYGNIDGSKTEIDILGDMRPYINQWIKFRVDVGWATTPTGYIKIYMKLPDQVDFVLANAIDNWVTFTGDVAAGNVGYVKWGVYIVPPNITRIAYHDDIRIINLKQPPTSPGLIWGNSIPDNNPAYYNGPYTVGSNLANPANYSPSNSSNVYIHPNLKYTASQNIAYSTSLNSNSIAGTPWSDFSRSTLNPAGGSYDAPGPSSRYLTNGWANAKSASTPTPLDTTEYYSFYLEPKNGYFLNFTNITFTVLRGGGTHPNIFALRSSIDNFAANISSPVTIAGTTTPTSISFNASALINITSPVTFRLYAYGSTATSGNTLVGVNDFQFNGQVLPRNIVTSVAFNTLSVMPSEGFLHITWSTASENNNNHFEVQTSDNGKDFKTVQIVQSKNSNSSTTQNYESVIAYTDITTIAGLPLFLSLLGFRRYKHQNKKSILLIVIVVGIGMAACKKHSNIVVNRGDNMYIRIKQVDNSGKASYSNIVSVRW